MQRQTFEEGQLEEYSYQRKQQFVFVSKIQIGSLKSQAGASPLPITRHFKSLLCAISKLHMKSPTSKVFRITEVTGFLSVNRKQEVAFIYTALRSKQKTNSLEKYNLIKQVCDIYCGTTHLVSSLPCEAHRAKSVFKKNTYKPPRSDTLLQHISYPLRGHTWYAIIIPKYALNKQNHSLLLISLTFFCEESLCSLSDTS